MMKTYIAAATAFLLMLGTAFGGSLVYSNKTSSAMQHGAAPATIPNFDPSPETIALWKATASSTDYMAPKVPI